MRPFVLYHLEKLKSPFQLLNQDEVLPLDSQVQSCPKQKVKFLWSLHLWYPFVLWLGLVSPSKCMEAAIGDTDYYYLLKLELAKNRPKSNDNTRNKPVCLLQYNKFHLEIRDNFDKISSRELSQHEFLVWTWGFSIHSKCASLIQGEIFYPEIGVPFDNSCRLKDSSPFY